jgi:hypothetical protein
VAVAGVFRVGLYTPLLPSDAAAAADALAGDALACARGAAAGRVSAVNFVVNAAARAALLCAETGDGRLLSRRATALFASLLRVFPDATVAPRCRRPACVTALPLDGQSKGAHT